MTPEERAKAVLAENVKRADEEFGAWDYEDTVALISEAIRQAENDALERAIAKIGEGMWVPEITNSFGSTQIVWKGMKPDEMIEALRSLRHNQTAG